MIRNASISVRILKLSCMLACSIWLAGCVALKVPDPVASAGNVEKLRSVPLAPVQVGTFALAKGVNPEIDIVLKGMRGSTLLPPQGTFSRQLRDELIAELKGAGLLDEKAPILIEGQLTDSKVDAAIGTGTGRLAAIITVTRAGQRVFSKEMVAQRQWESSFMGAVAIPAAMNNYSALYKDLIGKLIEDPDFRKALMR